MNIRIIFLSVVLIFCSVFAVFGQTKLMYSAAIKGGISKPNTLNRAYLYDDDGYIIRDRRRFIIADVQTYGPMFSVEASIIEKIKDWKVSFEQGFGIESKTFTIPVKVRYELAKWATLYVGASNIFNIYQIGTGDYLKTSQKYNTRGVVGFDLLLSQKYLLGCEYSYDITPFSKWKDYDVTYRFDMIALKFGFVF